MRHTFYLVAIAVLNLWVCNARAEDAASATQPVATALVALDYVDTSGEVMDQTQVHQKRVNSFAEALKRDLTATARFRFVDLNCKPQSCTSRTDPVELQKAARTAGAELIVIGGFHKMSTLVQWAKVEMIDADQGEVVFDRLVTFRNDSDEAWSRAEAFVVQEIKRASLPLASPAAAIAAPHG